MLRTPQTIAVLITSVGSAGAQCVIKTLRKQKQYPVKIFGCDSDEYNAGKFLVDTFHKVPHASAVDFLSTLQGICKLENINLLIPIMDQEILAVAEHAKDFQPYHPIISPLKTVVLCLDKYACQQRVEKIPNIRCPQLFSSLQDATLPVIIKPRKGTGSKGMRVIRKKNSTQEKIDPGCIIQEFIDGMEYSVDAYVSANRNFIACIPRRRIEVKNGLAVKTLIVEHPILIESSTTILRALGIIGPANLQFIQDKQGTIYFLEINPRFGGAYIASVEAGLKSPLYLLNELRGDPIKYKGYRRAMVMLRYWEEIYTHTTDANPMD